MIRMFNCLIISSFFFLHLNGQIKIDSIIRGEKIDEKIIYNEAFYLSFDTVKYTTNWTFYIHTKQKRIKRYSRTNHFYNDFLFNKVDFASNYRKSGYDRGHLVPAGDVTYDSMAMISSFNYINICPQVPSLNRGSWNKLENQVRNWVDLYDSLYVITGPIYSSNYRCLGKDSVPIPDYFFKVIFDLDTNDSKAIGFIFPNQKVYDELENYVVPIDDIEKELQLDFFPFLEENLEVILEKSIQIENWNW